VLDWGGECLALEHMVKSGVTLLPTKTAAMQEASFAEWVKDQFWCRTYDIHHVGSLLKEGV